VSPYPVVAGEGFRRRRWLEAQGYPLVYATQTTVRLPLEKGIILYSRSAPPIYIGGFHVVTSYVRRW